ncbi:MAG: phenylacetate--CoA ligase [Ktedonobacteraceae bacterium]
MFNTEIETMPRESLQALQNKRLHNTVDYVYHQVPYYRETLDRIGIKPDDIRTVEDLHKLPFTKKQTLRDYYPFGLLAVPRENLMRIHASSGTTGKPTVVCYTSNDIDVFAEVNARSLAAAGAKPGMILHNAYGYGLFTGGLGIHYGGERLGMTVVPVSGGATQRQVTLILDFQPEVICCTPSYAQTLGEEFKKRGISPQAISLKVGLLGAEPWTETIRTAVEASLGIAATNIYGLSEIVGPGVSQECIEARAGSHVWEDHFYPEVVDPETGNPLPDGKEGVLIFTHLTREAMPLLRYWTGDITYLSHDVCSCGRTHVRMGPIRGRADDMLIIRGINLYPTQVEEVLKDIPEVTPHYQLVVTRASTLDEIEVKVELTEEVFRHVAQDTIADDVIAVDHAMHALRNKIAYLIRETLGLGLTVTLVPPGTVPRSEGGKLRRVEDKRNL